MPHLLLSEIITRQQLSQRCSGTGEGRLHDADVAAVSSHDLSFVWFLVSNVTPQMPIYQADDPSMELLPPN